jgi:hypothetical protein
MAALPLPAAGLAIGAVGPTAGGAAALPALPLAVGGVVLGGVAPGAFVAEEGVAAGAGVTGAAGVVGLASLPQAAAAKNNVA